MPYGSHKAKLFSRIIKIKKKKKKKKASIAYQLGKSLSYRDRQAQSGKRNNGVTTQSESNR